MLMLLLNFIEKFTWIIAFCKRISVMYWIWPMESKTTRYTTRISAIFLCSVVDVIKKIMLGREKTIVPITSVTIVIIWTITTIIKINRPLNTLFFLSHNFILAWHGMCAMESYINSCLQLCLNLLPSSFFVFSSSSLSSSLIRFLLFTPNEIQNV